MASNLDARQARRENVSNRAAARDLIETVLNMTDRELEQLQAALNGEAAPITINPKRAYNEEAMDPMGVK
jgi:hypothetical protein